uniref:Uncharacterized protein n=1 Tax=Anguilla anguilla TaxID=7936 RepID=A0A0E9PVQ2_ANGAN
MHIFILGYYYIANCMLINKLE